MTQPTCTECLRYDLALCDTMIDLESRAALNCLGTRWMFRNHTLRMARLQAEAAGPKELR